MTNSERADRLLAIAAAIGEEMRLATGHRHWNLAVRRASFVTGEVLTVDGGWSAYGYL